MKTLRCARRREESGLTDAELALCSHSCAIPSGRRQPSLNLAAAVAVVLAQCFELRSSTESWSQLSLAAGGTPLTCVLWCQPAHYSFGVLPATAMLQQATGADGW